MDSQPTDPTPPEAQQLPNHKVKIKLPLQRSCNEKDGKGKICGGHLKRWFYAVDTVERACGDVERAWGKRAEVYRCERCKTLYLPNPSGPVAKNVAGIGQVTIVGLPTGKPQNEKAES
jgi:hypothetical protein